MRVVVLGAGAIGSLFGAGLAAAGHEVLLVARPDHAAAIARDGLAVVNRRRTVVRVEAASELPGTTPADAVLLTTKTFDLAVTAYRLARSVARPVPTLLPQNGLGFEPVVHGALRKGGWSEPAEWTVRAINTVPATWVGPGIVRETGTGELVLPGGSRAPLDARVRLFEQLLSGAGFVVRTVAEFDREVWRKVLVNAAINPLTAIHGVPNGRILEEPLRSEALRLLSEALAVAAREGQRFSEGEAVRDLERVARATAENRSSMLQDLDRGRPTEVDAISGELLRRATRYGLDLPATRAIVEELRRRTGVSRARRTQPS